MKYIIGCDNAGVNIKNILKQYIIDQGEEVEDCGCDSEKDTELYPNIAKTVCEKVIESNYEDRGVLVCGTGLGMAMTANKFKGIRAGVAHDIFSAERLVLSNNGNVVCFGERIIGPELAKKCMGEFMNLRFKDGRSTVKVEAINSIEQGNFR